MKIISYRGDSGLAAKGDISSEIVLYDLISHTSRNILSNNYVVYVSGDSINLNT